MSYDNEDLDLQHIAIVGMAGSFPGADNIQAFWQNLVAGTDSITFLNDEELLESGVSQALLSNPHYVKACSALNHIDLFDADFFTMSQQEAEVTDPQHRLLLEMAYTALEDAACIADDPEKRVGVFASVGISHYLLQHIITQPELLAHAGLMQVLIGNDKSYACTRISHKLNLTGPSMCIDTACSSSMIAITQAVKSLLAYECDVALSGGAKINIPQKTGYLWAENSLLSPDGHCRAFDADAKGIIFGSGVGMIVLKRLADAQNDGNHIYAIIKGVAVNNDGAQKINYLAPSITGQTSVIAEAMAVAEVSAEQISYIEAHGTGTAMGDPIEIAALVDVYSQSTQKTGFCAIGSLKTNIGYLEVASGVAAVIKTALALKYKQIPPSLHYKKNNPEIDFANSPFYLNTKLRHWDTQALPRTAGVSSFGIGGTNAHIILSEAPALATEHTKHASYLLVLSAKTLTALDKATENLANYLQANPHSNLADVAYTLQCGRKAYDYRRFFICADINEAIAILRTSPADCSRTNHCQPNTARLLSHFPNMPTSISHQEDAMALGNLWLQGIGIKWADYYTTERRSLLSLPTYPFERKRYWLDIKKEAPLYSHNTPIAHSTKPSIKAHYTKPRTEIEQRISKIWQKYLAVDRVGIHDNFFDLGGNSVSAMTVINAAAEAGILIKPIQLFRYPTIATLIPSLDSGFSDDTKTNIELHTEVTLPLSFNPDLPRATTPAHALFLTGATGFVGAFLLSQLLEEYPTLDIYCLIRAKNTAEAQIKIQTNLAQYALWRPEFHSRIKPILGDLEKPLLGMSDQVFSDLSKLIDVIVHCGASVNFVSSYEQLKPVNISGTCEILKLAGQKKIKPIHYISTVSVFPKPEYVPNQRALESETLDFNASYKGGYAQTKWVAEKIMLLAQNQGFPINIYRLGRITGSSKTGAWNTNDFLCKVIKGSIQLQLAPKTNYSIDFTPVDYVSEAIVNIIQSEVLGNTYHLIHPNLTPVSEIINYANKIGYPIKEVPYSEWYQSLLNSVEQNQDNALHVVIDLFEPSQEDDPWENNILAFDCRNTITALQKSAITCPSISQLLPVYFDYLVSSNFLPEINH